jgi:transcriptional regulator with XRE-family HTH domain
MRKSDTAETFRRRLIELIARTGLSRARFARKAGFDRSTLSQLLSEANVRLPRAETIAGIAASHNVSIDWLLGLSEEDQVGADIVSEPAIEPEAGSPADERLQRWHAEARGFKVRYVPSSLPDQMKTEAVIAYETRRLSGEAAQAWTGQVHARIVQATRGEHEIEVCSALQSLESFARGEGVWRDLPQRERREQLTYAAHLVDELYPAYRWFLFDGRERFSAPYTVFGPKRAAIYVGDMYFVFTSTGHIKALSQHFDTLIRSARIQPNAMAGYLRSLA